MTLGGSGNWNSYLDTKQPPKGGFFFDAEFSTGVERGLFNLRLSVDDVFSHDRIISSHFKLFRGGALVLSRCVVVSRAGRRY